MPVAPSLTGTRDSVLIPSGSPSCLKQCDCAELATPSAQRDAVMGHSAHSSLLTASLCPWLRGPRRVTAGDRALPLPESSSLGAQHSQSILKTPFHCLLGLLVKSEPCLCGSLVRQARGLWAPHRRPKEAGSLCRIPHLKPKPLPRVSKTCQQSSSAHSAQGLSRDPVSQPCGSGACSPWWPRAPGAPGPAARQATERNQGGSPRDKNMKYTACPVPTC